VEKLIARSSAWAAAGVAAEPLKFTTSADSPEPPLTLPMGTPFVRHLRSRDANLPRAVP